MAAKMMMATTVKLKIVQPMLWAGTARARSGHLWTTPEAAAKLIASGNCVLANPDDIKLLLDEPAPCSTMARPLRWATR